MSEVEDISDGKWYEYPYNAQCLDLRFANSISIRIWVSAPGINHGVFRERGIHCCHPGEAVITGPEGIEEFLEEKRVGIEILMMAAAIGSVLLGIWDEAASGLSFTALQRDSRCCLVDAIGDGGGRVISGTLNRWRPSLAGARVVGRVGGEAGYCWAPRGAWKRHGRVRTGRAASIWRLLCDLFLLTTRPYHVIYHYKSDLHIHSTHHRIHRLGILRNLQNRYKNRFSILHFHFHVSMHLQYLPASKL